MLSVCSGNAEEGKVTSLLQFVSVELGELSEDFRLVLQCDARSGIHHLHSQHPHRRPGLPQPPRHRQHIRYVSDTNERSERISRHLHLGCTIGFEGEAAIEVAHQLDVHFPAHWSKL